MTGGRRDDAGRLNANKIDSMDDIDLAYIYAYLQISQENKYQ